MGKISLKNSEYFALFSNVIISLHLDHFYVFWLDPIAINKTREHIQMYYIVDNSANGEELKNKEKKMQDFGKML